MDIPQSTHPSPVQIEAEARAVRAEATALERNLGDVAAAVRQVTDSLKLLGDFENYGEGVGCEKGAECRKC